ncbi:hypothetical protein BH11ACT2_BH11ACT2_12250 [soil metagenome]
MTTDSNLRRVRRSGGWAPDVSLWTAISAFVVGGLMLGEFFTALWTGSRPQLDAGVPLEVYARHTHIATLIRVLVDTLLMAFLIVFLGGFRQMVTRVRDDLQWMADLAFGAGLVFVGVSLVGDSLEAGGALDTVGSVPDGTAIRALTEGYLVMFGPMSCVLLALVSAASGYVILATRVLPAWVGRLAWLVALLNAIAVSSIFGGTDADTFYSVGGWGVAAFATFPWLAWVVTVGAVTLRERTLHVVRDEVDTVQLPVQSVAKD